MRRTWDRPFSDPAVAGVEQAPVKSPHGNPRVRFVDDRALVDGIRAGNPVALAEFHDRFALLVERILWGILGPDRELSDLHHDVFVRALASIGKLREAEALSGWMNAIAVHTAKSCLEKRISRRRWQSRVPAEAVPEETTPDLGRQLEAREVLRAVHAVLDHLEPNARVVFALRYLHGLELEDVAEACEASLATVKRRLSRAEAEFAALVRDSPLLHERLQKGSPRWIRS